MSLKGKVVQQTCDCEFEEIPELYLKSDVDLAVQQLKEQILKYPSLYNSPKRIVSLIVEEFQ